MIELDLDHQLRYIRDLVGHHINRIRKTGSVPSLSPDNDEANFREAPLYLDSLELVQIAGLAADVMGLRDFGLEDLLLVQPSVRGWQQLLDRALHQGLKSWGFHSSGSQGEPKLVRHRLDLLSQEVRELGEILGRTSPQRIVSLVPSHHIYGFLWTVLFPQLFGIPVVRQAAVFSDFRPQDLIVATPFLILQWRLRGILPPQDCCVLVSTAPFTREASDWLDDNARSWVEIYGSSETAGIGYRTSVDQGFTLFSYLEVLEQGNELLLRRDGQNYPFADHVRLEGRMVYPLGRKDGAIQVGGVNVWPDKVRTFLESLGEVQQAWVRPYSEGGELRLKAWVIPKVSLPTDQLESVLRARCATHLSSAEQPARYTFEHHPPLSPIGKLVDW